MDDPMNRLELLSNEKLVQLAARVFCVIDALMDHPANGYQPYGWDWPTFGAIYPRKRAAWRRLAAEATRRGIKSYPDERKTFKRNLIREKENQTA